MSLKDRMAKYVLQEMTVDKIVMERTLNLSNGISDTIRAKQYDHKSRVLNIVLEKNVGEQLNLANTRVYLVVKRPDNVRFKLEGTPSLLENGKVSFSFTQEFLAVAGQLHCEIVVMGIDDSVLSFPVFTIVVDESIHDEMFNIVTSNSDEEFTTIDDLELIEDKGGE